MLIATLHEGFYADLLKSWILLTNKPLEPLRSQHSSLYIKVSLNDFSSNYTITVHTLDFVRIGRIKVVV